MEMDIVLKVSAIQRYISIFLETYPLTVNCLIFLKQDLKNQERNLAKSIKDQLARSPFPCAECGRVATVYFFLHISLTHSYTCLIVLKKKGEVKENYGELKNCVVSVKRLMVVERGLKKGFTT